MTRLREIKKWGSCFVLVLRVSDMEDLGLEVGDKIEVEDFSEVRERG